MAGPGQRVEVDLVQTLVPMLTQWQALLAAHPEPCDKRPLHCVHPQQPGLVLDDWLVGLRSSAGTATTAVWIALQASKLANKDVDAARPDKLLSAWIQCLASAACGQPAGGILIGADAVVHVTPPAQDAARTMLGALMLACRDGLLGAAPLPTAVFTGLAFLKDPAKARPAYEGSGFGAAPGEGREACLARLFPDYAALSGQANFVSSTTLLYGSYREWLDQNVTVAPLPHSGVEAIGHDA